MLTETYSASTLAISRLIFWPERSHDSILFSLLSRSALKIAHQPSVPSELLRKLQSRVRSGRQGLLTVGERVYSNVLEGGEGGVALEPLRNVLGSLITNTV